AAESVVADLGGDAGRIDIFGEVALQRVTAGHLVELAALLVQPHPEPALLVKDVGDVQTAGSRNPANVNTMTPISERSRSPMTVSVSMERSSSPPSSAVSTGVLPFPSFWRGAFTESAGLCSSTPPVTRWSKSIRTAAMCCLRVAVDRPLAFAASR